MSPPPIIKGWPGYYGDFTRDQAEGALPNGSRVRKINSQPGDTHKDGEMATILGSIAHPKVFGGMACYFVEWDTTPRVAVAVVGTRVERV